MRTGSHGRYSWLISGQNGIGHLLKQCPQALLGRFVVVTSFDSGPLTLNETRQTMGWSEDQGLCYTTRVSSVDTLPYDYFDEWYVFKNAVRLAGCEVFVNAGGFMQTRFWSQLNRFNPESYIAHGDLFLFASANQELFTTVALAFSDYG